LKISFAKKFPNIKLLFIKARDFIKMARNDMSFVIYEVSAPKDATLAMTFVLDESLLMDPKKV